MVARVLGSWPHLFCIPHKQVLRDTACSPKSMLFLVSAIEDSVAATDPVSLPAESIGALFEEVVARKKVGLFLEQPE